MPAGPLTQRPPALCRGIARHRLAPHAAALSAPRRGGPSIGPTRAPPAAPALSASAPPAARRCRRRRRLAAPRAAGGGPSSSSNARRDLYEVLGVPPTATDRDIKRAYRQKALKLHPDVNKAPDAQAQFMEAKNAFATLSDPQQRKEYDRRRAFFRNGGGAGGGGGGFGGFGGYGGGNGYGGGGFGGGYGYGGPGQQQQKAGQTGQTGQGEDFYGLEDFFRDLGGEVEGWRKKRREQKASSSSTEPASLWDELAAIGEELVDYLEETLGIEDDEEEGKRGGSGSGSGSGSSKAGASSTGSGGGGNGASSRGPIDDFEAWKRRYDPAEPKGAAAGGGSKGGGAAAGAGGAASAKPPPPPPPPKAKPAMSSADEIEDQLAALKRKVGRDK